MIEEFEFPVALGSRPFDGEMFLVEVGWIGRDSKAGVEASLSGLFWLLYIFEY